MYVVICVAERLKITFLFDAFLWLIAYWSLQIYSPVVQWAAAELGAQFSASDSIFGAQQPEETVAAVRSFLEGTSILRSPTI